MAITAFTSLLLAGCADRASEDASADVEAITLFAGENLDQWVIESNGQFSVADGILKVNRGSGWLRTKEAFDDFTLVMEFRFLEKDANSGIFVRTGATSHNDDTGWPDNGYQIQCRDTLEGEYPLATLIPYGAPDCSPTSDLEALNRAYKPVGDWQTFEITCIGESMSVSLNGELITTVTDVKNLSGHIGIQGEEGLLEFRKVEVVPVR